MLLKKNAIWRPYDQIPMDRVWYLLISHISDKLHYSDMYIPLSNESNRSRTFMSRCLTLCLPRWPINGCGDTWCHSNTDSAWRSANAGNMEYFVLRMKSLLIFGRMQVSSNQRNHRPCVSILNIQFTRVLIIGFEVFPRELMFIKHSMDVCFKHAGCQICLFSTHMLFISIDIWAMT